MTGLLRVKRGAEDLKALRSISFVCVCVREVGGGGGGQGARDVSGLLIG